jgi:hypothetical protein
LDDLALIALNALALIALDDLALIALDALALIAACRLGGQSPACFLSIANGTSSSSSSPVSFLIDDGPPTDDLGAAIATAAPEALW